MFSFIKSKKANLSIDSTDIETNKVSHSFFNPVRKYTIKNPDEYDLEFGLSVEIGVVTVEDYYYTKGRIQGWDLALQVCRDSQ